MNKLYSCFIPIVNMILGIMSIQKIKKMKSKKYLFVLVLVEAIVILPTLYIGSNVLSLLTDSYTLTTVLSVVHIYYLTVLYSLVPYLMIKHLQKKE